MAAAKLVLCHDNVATAGTEHGAVPATHMPLLQREHDRTARTKRERQRQDGGVGGDQREHHARAQQRHARAQLLLPLCSRRRHLQRKQGSLREHATCFPLSHVCGTAIPKHVASSNKHPS